MKRIKIAAIFAALLIAFTFLFAGCGEEKKEGEGYTIDQDKYLLGLGAVPKSAFMQTDDCADMENIFPLVEGLGITTMRVWMHIPSVLQIDDDGNITVIEERRQFYQNYIDGLQAAGVDRILAMTHYYLYPKEIRHYDGCFPDPEEDEEAYILFMQTLQKSYEVLAETFPDVKYWEPGNEPNIDNGHFVHKLGWLDGDPYKTNYQYLFDLEGQARITLDLGYYCGLGIKSVDPANTIVMPGLVATPYVTSRDIFDEMYRLIDSGEMPTGLEADKNTDNYFEIANWHPYTWSMGQHLPENWKNAQKEMYDAMIDGGDKGKKVWYTEYGFPDNQRLTQEQIAEAWVEFFDWCKSDFPEMETVIIFRLFDHKSFEDPTSIETSFGLFETGNYATEGIVPKPAAYTILRYFHGENADVSGIESLMKKTSESGSATIS